jgi:hypothetical protein
MSTEKTGLIVFIALNVLMYIVAFSVAYARKQNVTVYFWLLGLQLGCLFLMFLLIPKPTAGGMGIGLGIYLIFFLVVQIGLLLALVITTLVRLNSATVWITLGALPVVVAACLLVIWFVDFNRIYLALLPATDEKELIMRNDILHTPDGKPFTGRTKHRGDDPILHKLWNVDGAYAEVESEDEHNLDYAVEYRKYQYREIWRLTRYRNGIKEGKEQYYLYSGGKVPKIFDFFDKETRIRRTRYFGHIHYKNGLKDGEEHILYPRDYFGRETRNAQYAAGELLSVKQFDESGYNGKVSIYDEDRNFEDFEIAEPTESDLQRFNYRIASVFENEKAVYSFRELYYCNGEYTMASSSAGHAAIYAMRAKPRKFVIDWEEDGDRYSLYLWPDRDNALKVFDAVFTASGARGELAISISGTQEDISVVPTLSNGQITEKFEKYEWFLFKNDEGFLVNKYYNRQAGGWRD